MARKWMPASSLTLPWPALSDRRPNLVGADGALLAVTVALALIGLVMVFSASAVVAGSRFHDSIYYLKRQLAWLMFGLLLLHIASRLDYMVWRQCAVPLLALTAVLLAVVLIPSLGTAAKGARRWIRLGPISLQPAEMLKLATVLYLAAYVTRKQDRLGDLATGFLPPLVVVGVLAALVLAQPDMGTVVVIGTVTLGLLFLAGARWTHLLGVALAALPAAAILIVKSPYRRRRFMTFLSPWDDPTAAGFQVTQSFLAFGSGGSVGVGLGEGKQKLFFLPEAHTDFVLALIGEELGLVGTAGVMLLFALVVLKGFQIAGRAREPFGRHLALGITLLLGVQVLINAGVATGMLPTKGLTLPLVSYGGSSLLISLLAIGILLSISRDRQGGRRGAYGQSVG
jgi:cell division protein FtsW